MDAGDFSLALRYVRDGEGCGETVVGYCEPGRGSVLRVIRFIESDYFHLLSSVPI